MEQEGELAFSEGDYLKILSGFDEDGFYMVTCSNILLLSHVHTLTYTQSMCCKDIFNPTLTAQAEHKATGRKGLVPHNFIKLHAAPPGAEPAQDPAASKAKKKTSIIGSLKNKLGLAKK